MANSRKTQGEIDRLLKKIVEGMDVYEDTYEKFQGASSTALKERFEAELKKEIKKLQRLREQIKVLITSGEVKDKKHLEKARKDIEGKMEAFKSVEKETKTKAFSKEGLSQGARLDPAEAAKHSTSTWIRDAISELGSQIESLEYDIENAGRKRKGGGGYDPKEERLQRSRFHTQKLEQLLRLMDNDELTPDDIDAVQPDVEAYVEGNVDDDYVEEFEELYDCFDLPEAPLKNDSDDDEPPVKASPKLKAAEKKATPVTTAAATAGGHVIQKESTPPTTKATPKTPAAVPAKAPVAVAAKKEAPAPAAAKKAPAAAQPTKVAAPQPAGTVKQPVAAAKTTAQVAASPVREERPAPLAYAQVAQQAAKQDTKQQPAPTPAPAAAAAAPMIGSAMPGGLAGGMGGGEGEGGLELDDLLEDDEGLNDDTFGDDAMGDAGSGGLADMAGMSAGWNKSQPLPPKPPGASAEKAPKPTAPAQPAAPAPTPAQVQASNQQQAAHQAAVTMLEQSVKNLPHPNDSERLKAYIPPNPYKTPAWYPQTIHSALTHAETLGKFEIEALFFIFYYQPNTYQQYLAAKELKKQSWRYHKKYLTWFQRHDTPKQTTDDFEQGAYIYFDFESGWCQRIKNDFTFKYQFLEDELQ